MSQRSPVQLSGQDARQPLRDKLSSPRCLHASHGCCPPSLRHVHTLSLCRRVLTVRATARSSRSVLAKLAAPMKGFPSPLHFVRTPAAFRSSVSHRSLPCYVSATAAMESPLLTTPSPPCRSWSFTELRSNFPTRRADSFPTGELPRRHRAGELPPHRRPHSSPRDGAPSHVRRFRC
jgi:hypothetical protein